ncbi:MAG: hypothetical protein Q4B70_07070 [Lachnospiraceae bacterium]|nr:hypothetical protein [Lachnospiraceae bacterium]
MKMMKKMLSFTLTLALVFGMVSIVSQPKKVMALDSDPYIQKNNTIVVNFPGQDYWDNLYWFNVSNKQIPKSVKKLKLKSSNKNCVAISTHSNGRDIVLSARKKGTATITISGTAGKKTYSYKAKVKVVGWTNPVSKVSINGKNYASKVTKKNHRMYTLKTNDNTIKLSVKGKSGYKVKSLKYIYSYKETNADGTTKTVSKTKKIKNNGTFQRVTDRELSDERIVVFFSTGTYKNLWDHMTGPSKQDGPGVGMTIFLENKNN